MATAADLAGQEEEQAVVIAVRPQEHRALALGVGNPNKKVLSGRLRPTQTAAAAAAPTALFMVGCGSPEQPPPDA